MVRKIFVVLLFCCSTAFAQQKKPVLAPFFQGNALPVPPMQNTPWPHGDDALSNATAKLFEQGLADPRGLEYREIEIAVGSPWNGGGYPIKTHGWVLSQKGNNGQFAVAWNGLIYPVLKVGAVADLDKDWAADSARTIDPFNYDYSWGGANISEATSTNFSSPSGLKLALLLRLGKEKIVSRINKPLSGDPADPYLNVATDWAWLAFERAVCAHERGDDNLALVDAQMLTKIQPLVEAEAKRCGFKPPYSNSPLPVDQQPYLPFLAQLPTLLKDSERRIAEQKNPPIHKDGIPGLIEDLQNVDARQWGQPGGVSLAQDKRIQALVKRGDEIVEPLLNTMENDTRLTRSVSFGRDFFRDRHLISVASAAYATIADLLQVHFKSYNEYGKPLSKKEFVAKIRDYWDKMKNIRPAERYYATLKDDIAGKDQWLQAAANIIQPTDVETHGSWITEPNRKPGQQIKLRGESLRDGRVPSVSQLLAKRSDDMAAVRTGSSDDMFLFLDAGKMALDLAEWDKTAAIPILQKRLTRAMNIGAQPRNPLIYGDSTVESYGGIIAKMTDALARCGDNSAYDKYAAWIERVDLKGLFSSDELPKPLIAGVAHPSIQHALDYLFNNPKSALYDYFTENAHFDFNTFWQSPLPITEGFRKKVLRALANKNPAGDITFNPRKNWNANTEAEINIKGFGLGFRGSNDDPDTPPAGEKRSFRICDAYVYFYSQYQNGPKIQLFWPTEKRDVSVAACRKWLEGQK